MQFLDESELMPPLPIVDIPQAHVVLINKILELPKEQRESLQTALTEIKPMIGITAYVTTIAKKTRIPINEMQGIIELLISLYISYEVADIRADTFIESVCHAIKQHPEIDQTDIDNKLINLHKFLKIVMGLENTFGAMSKANEILIEHQRRFCRARIITDIRPIYKHEVKSGIATSVIVHQLKITYHTDSEEHMDFFVALDDSDLKSFEKTIKRAKAKEKSLRDYIKKCGMNVI